MYANTARPRVCPCGRPIELPEDGTRGRRPRYCGYCRQVREALRFVRAAQRRLEAIQDPALVGRAR